MQLGKANANAWLVASTRSMFENWIAQIYVEHRFRDRQAAALYFAERHSASRFGRELQKADQWWR